MDIRALTNEIHDILGDLWGLINKNICLNLL